MQKVYQIKGGLRAVINGNINADYKFSTSTTSPPSAGYVNYDNVTQLSATKLYISAINDQGADIGDILREFINVGDVVGNINRSNAGHRQLWNIDVIVDNTSWFEYDISPVSDSGGDFTDNQKLLIAWFDVPGGDMNKSVYDILDSGVVDDSEKLGGALPSVYDQSSHVSDATVHITSDQNDALDGANTPNSGNVLATMNDIPLDYSFAISDETTDLTNNGGVAVYTGLIARNLAVISEVIVGLTEAGTGNALVFDVHLNGTSMFSTLPTIDDSEVSTLTATTAAVLSTTSATKGDKVEAFIVLPGGSNAGKGAKIYILAT